MSKPTLRVLAGESEPEYCDHCGEQIPRYKRVAIERLEFDVESANVGESAVLCLTCNLQLQLEHDEATDYEEFGDWLSEGLRKGWVKRYCSTHDGHLTDREIDMFEAGDDPCVWVMRTRDPDVGVLPFSNSEQY